MAGQFKVGEILVGQNFILNPKRNGQECTVVGGLEPRLCRNLKIDPHHTYTASRYVVEWSDGTVSAVASERLRRKRPPSGEQSVIDMFKLPAPKREREPA